MWSRVGVWLAMAGLLWIASDPRTPWLLGVRGLIAPVLIVVALAGMAGAVRRFRSVGGVESALLLVAFAAVAGLTLREAWQFDEQRTAVLAAGAQGDPEARMLGTHFVIGYRDFAEVALLAERGLIGGIYLARRNVRGRDVAAVRAEVDALQVLRARAGLPPLIVAADQEGGEVAHMSPPLAPLPPLSGLVAEAAAAGGAAMQLAAQAREYGLRQGLGLAALGVTLNFGPVVDLHPGKASSLLDTHTRIASRAISADPELVTLVAAAYAEGLAAAGVAPTYKHFPGLGGVQVDTHHFPATLSRPLAQLAAHDWMPFRDAATAGHAIMLGHVVLPALDAGRPASLSPAVVGQLVRGEWGHDGLLITDDLNMGAVFRRGPCRSAVEALQAGVDLVLISYDPDQYYRAMHCALQAARGGTLAPADSAGTARRVAELQQRAVISARLAVRTKRTATDRVALADVHGVDASKR